MLLARASINQTSLHLGVPLCGSPCYRLTGVEWCGAPLLTRVSNRGHHIGGPCVCSSLRYCRSFFCGHFYLFHIGPYIVPILVPISVQFTLCQSRLVGQCTGHKLVAYTLQPFSTHLPLCTSYITSLHQRKFADKKDTVTKCIFRGVAPRWGLHHLGHCLRLSS